MNFTFLFWRLITGHLIGDFPFQTDTVFNIKIKHRWGVILHGSIAGTFVFIFAIPYLPHYPILWPYLLLNIVFHILVDKGKLLINPKVKRVGFIFFILDQIVHIGTCWVISILIPTYPHYGASLPIYGNTLVMIFISVYIGVTYGVLYFILSIKSSFNLPLAFPNWNFKIIEFIERGIIATFVLLGSFYYLLIPLALFPRGFLSFLKREKHKIGIFDLILSLIFALIGGVLLKVAVRIWGVPW